MFKKFTVLALVAALVFTLGGLPAFAQNKPSTNVIWNRVNDSPDSAGKKETQPSGSLKANIQKLIIDAKAGKGFSVSDPQNQPRQSNNLSKATKIAIVAGIVAVVILIIVVVHEKNHFFDGAVLSN